MINESGCLYNIKCSLLGETTLHLKTSALVSIPFRMQTLTFSITFPKDSKYLQIHRFHGRQGLKKNNTENRYCCTVYSRLLVSAETIGPFVLSTKRPQRAKQPALTEV